MVKKFERPKKRKMALPSKGKGIKVRRRTGKMPKGMTSVPWYFPPEKLEKLRLKTLKECPTSSPIHDILNLLVEYYLSNELILEKQLQSIHDPKDSEEIQEYKYAQYKYVYQDYNGMDKLVLTIPAYRYKRLAARAKREGFPVIALINILIDYYLSNDFVVKTSIIRVPPDRFKGTPAELRKLEDVNFQKKWLDKNNDLVVE